MYQKVSTDMNFAQREEEVIKFWRDEDIFKKTVKLREGAPAFTFFDGPPTANGKPHIGHVETRAIKDIIPRYRTMKGYDVLRKAGWDTHGLPVELEVEKMLGLDGKPQIEEYGIEPFIKKCKESVWKYKTEWEQMSERVGYWADMEHPYITYEDNYIESEWWSLKKIYEKGLLYKGHKIVPYCPRCGTALSSHEVAQGYKRVEETFRGRALQGEGHGKHLPHRVDDHPVDAAQQRRAVRQSGRGLCEADLRGRHLLYGGRAGGVHLRRQGRKARHRGNHEGQRTGIHGV